MKKLYFSASISGGRDDSQIYSLIVEKLKKDFIILTEHIGNENLVKKDKNLSAKEIYTRDINFLNQADFVVAEVSTPSLGVGYELSYAFSINKPTYVLYNLNKSKPLSKMISGNQFFKIFYYSNLDMLNQQLDQIIKLQKN